MEGTLDAVGGVVDPFIGREIAGKYRVIRRLGTGGMGAVYQAQHLATGGDVAIKVLHGTALGDDNALRRFQLEAQNAAALKHANTIRVTDFGVDQGTLYLVMEYLEGQPLSDVLARQGPLPWKRVVHIARQVLKSLWEAHEHPKRIIHRDIKPGNLFLVDLPGEPDHVRVLDFGISRALEGSGAGTQGLIGTPFYMAPELWRGETVDARTDLYALGCVVYQALAGTPPFVPPPSATDSLYPLLSMHLNERPRPLAALGLEVPGWLVRWVDAMMAKEPSRRPESARAALEALDRGLAGGDETAAAHGPTPRPATAPGLVGEMVPERPRRAGLPAWFVVALVLIGVGALSAIVIAVSKTSGPDPSGTSGTSEEESVTSPPPPSGPHPAFGNLIVAYRSRLSAADHLDDDGTTLDDAAAVVTQDRRRYHAGLGDAEDGFDLIFKDETMQGQLYQLVDGFLDEPTRAGILDGRPLLDVAIYQRGLVLSIVPE